MIAFVEKAIQFLDCIFLPLVLKSSILGLVGTIITNLKLAKRLGLTILRSALF